RKLVVSLDKADNVIEGAAPFAFLSLAKGADFHDSFCLQPLAATNPRHPLEFSPQLRSLASRRTPR
ncbi:MAG: hypothetical protein ACRD4S_01790, partial [Candidatus Acidiferrales bacterium]